MNALIILVILLFGLFLCSVLGGTCAEGYTNSKGGSANVYKGSNGGTASVVTTSSGQKVIYAEIPNPKGGSPTKVEYKQSGPGSATYSSSNGLTASISNNTITVETSAGQTTTFTLSNTKNSSSTSSTSTSSTSSGKKSYDNYNHYSGTYNSSMLTPGATFVGPNGGQVVVGTNSTGQTTLTVTLTSGQAPLTFTTQQPQTTTTEGYTTYMGDNGSATIYYGPYGETATVINTENNGQLIEVSTPSGDYIFTNTATTPTNTENTSMQYYGTTGYPVPPPSSTTYQDGEPVNASATVVTGPYGNTAYYAEGPNGNAYAGTNANNNPYYGQPTASGAVATGPNGNSAYYVEGPNGNAYAGTNANNNPYYYNNAYNPYYGQPTASGAVATGPNGNSAYYAEGPNGNVYAGTNANNNPYYYNNMVDPEEYYSSLPPGIPASQIPPGQEDLYILKSQVVPPVCPACPTCPSSSSSSKEKCPPCPACARCPEPSITCKAVPNYNAISDEYLPVPVLNSFSTFGM